jgi:outer membrane protein
MHRSIAIAILGVSLIVLGLVRADAAGPAVPKLAYVDLQRTLHETNAGKQARDKLEKEKQKKQQELDKRQQELQKSAQELDKQRQVLKPDVLKQRERELQEKYVKLQETYMKLQQELAQEEAKLVREIFAKAAPVIQQIAKSKGYTMVLEKNESAVLFADPSLDITAEVNKLIK